MPSLCPLVLHPHRPGVLGAPVQSGGGPHSRVRGRAPCLLPCHMPTTQQPGTQQEPQGRPDEAASSHRCTLPSSESVRPSVQAVGSLVEWPCWGRLSECLSPSLLSLPAGPPVPPASLRPLGDSAPQWETLLAGLPVPPALSPDHVHPACPAAHNPHSQQPSWLLPWSCEGPAWCWGHAMRRTRPLLKAGGGGAGDSLLVSRMRAGEPAPSSSTSGSRPPATPCREAPARGPPSLSPREGLSRWPHELPQCPGHHVGPHCTCARGGVEGGACWEWGWAQTSRWLCSLSAI